MRIAAGIVLIVAALINGCAGIGYAGVGAAANVVGKAGSSLGAEMQKQAAAQGGNMSAKDKAEFEKAMGNLKGVEAAGGGLMIFGIFLFVLLGLQIGAAVTLFMQKAKMYVLVVAGVGILAEIVGMVITSSFHVLGLIGIVGSVLAFIAAQGYGKSAPAAPAAAA
jgi:hypothetical protein